MHRIAALTAAGALAAPAFAPAADASDLWATVNICDTARHPDMMGVRARMPGDGRRERMYMRFAAQFRDGDRWRRVDGAVSKWLYAGSALFRSEELGYTFDFDPPPAGESYLMRGVVRFQWRRRRHGKLRVVHHTRLHTHGGHPARGADPRRFSAAHCRIRH